MRFLRPAALALVLSLLLIGSAQAAPSAEDGAAQVVSPQDITEMGMRTRAIRLSNVSSDGRVVVFTDKERDPQLLAQGQVWRLRVFRFSAGSTKPKLTTIQMPTTDLSQVAISPDGARALAISDRGTRFIGVDLVKGEAQVIFRLTSGEPSFRVMPEVVWFEKGRFHTIGYFMDADQISTGDAIVSVDVPGRGFSAIHKVRDITEMMKVFKGFQQALWHTSDQAYFVGRGRLTDPFQLVSVFGDKPVVITSAEKYSNLAAGENRVVYIAKNGDKGVMAVYDAPMAKRWEIDSAGKDMEYTYMSADGKTLLASTFDVKGGRMTTYYAQEGDGYKLHPVPAMTDLQMGTQRFSGNGRVIWMYGSRGLREYIVPASKAMKGPAASAKPKSK